MGPETPGLEERLNAKNRVHEMIELALVVCLAADTAKCKDVGLTYASESLTPQQCMMRAIPEVAKWTGEHPRWVVKKWSCRPAGHIAKI
jgi:hypothetical protein